MRTAFASGSVQQCVFCDQLPTDVTGLNGSPALWVNPRERERPNAAYRRRGLACVWGVRGLHQLHPADIRFRTPSESSPELKKM